MKKKRQAKKTTEKKAVKKPAAKKKKAAPTKSHALRSVTGTLTFKLANGREVSSLFELAHVFDNLEENIYQYHANEGKNDFAEWITNVFKSKPLAEAIRALPKRDAQVKILKYLVHELDHK